MSSKDIPQTCRDDVMAAREAKKLAKQKAKAGGGDIKKDIPKVETKTDNPKPVEEKSTDVVDRAVVHQPMIDASNKSKEEIKAERAAKKQAKQAKKKGDDAKENTPSETIKEIVQITKEVEEVTAKPVDSEQGKSKAELRAERRAKQEAQRAAKVSQQTAKTDVKTKNVTAAIKVTATPVDKEKSPKPKPLEKMKTKLQLAHRVNWFQHLYREQDDQDCTNRQLNTNLHPAIVRLGEQLASRVVAGSNARCIALLDALKKLISTYSVPARTEFSRGLESVLRTNTEALWTRRTPCAAQLNALKYLRYHLNALPHNVDEFDAKKTLQEEIDRYIREQIDMAGEAISIAVRRKISSGDNILTYGCSSLIERIFRDAWSAGVQFRVVVVGSRLQRGAREMLRRLLSHGVPCTYVDITALSFVMNTVTKVVLGASSLLGNGAVLGACGTALVALAARERNIPALVACETHKFAERVHTDAFVHNELGNPDDLIDTSDDNSPLKDWRSNPNLTPLNLTYDVTPASLITAVVTELAILPCTSAPVVLRFKLSEYGI